MVIYTKSCLSVVEQERFMKDAKEYYEVFKLDPKKKYLSDYEDTDKGEPILYNNKKKVLLTIYAIVSNGNSPHEFINSLKEYKPIYRDGKIHNPLCEYATGTDCDCPCNHEYHGLHGREIPSLETD